MERYMLQPLLNRNMDFKPRGHIKKLGYRINIDASDFLSKATLVFQAPIQLSCGVPASRFRTLLQHLDYSGLGIVVDCFT